jgi:hypothetical protein
MCDTYGLYPLSVLGGEGRSDRMTRHAQESRGTYVTVLCTAFLRNEAQETEGAKHDEVAVGVERKRCPEEIVGGDRKSKLLLTIAISGI